MQTNLVSFLIATILFNLSFAINCIAQNGNCICDTLIASNAIKSREFNRINRFDTTTFPVDSLYGISELENRLLWYRDIENPTPTKYTKYWNDYESVNYHADNIDFVSNYENKTDIEIAFQFGPNMDLWAYHTFVIRKLGCCYLATRSYFRHARFTYKGYAIIDQNKVDSLFSVLEHIHVNPIDTVDRWNYSGYFADNRNKKNFYINFEKEIDIIQNEKDTSLLEHVPKKEIIVLYNFVDHRIKWVSTYP